MQTEAELFAAAMAATGEAYLDAESLLRTRGQAALGELRRHLEDSDPLARLFARVLLPWIEGRAPENDQVLAYLEDLPVRVAMTPAGTPRTIGIPYYLGRHFQDRVVELIALRLVKVPGLPRWYALGGMLYLGEQRRPEATEALLRLAVETPDPERRRYAVDAIVATGDPDLRRKLAAEESRLALLSLALPDELNGLAARPP